MKFRDWDIVFVRNEKGISIFNKIFYFLIRFFLKSKYNHCLIIRDFNGKLFVCEAIASGFVVSKTVDKFIEEQQTLQRTLLVKRFKVTLGAKERFNKLLGANYNARYLKYLLNKNHNKFSFNCFQSIGYIINEKKWWETKPNYLLKILH
jgi:hypothetical protein